MRTVSDHLCETDVGQKIQDLADSCDCTFSEVLISLCEFVVYSDLWEEFISGFEAQL